MGAFDWRNMNRFFLQSCYLRWNCKDRKSPWGKQVVYNICMCVYIYNIYSIMTLYNIYYIYNYILYIINIYYIIIQLYIHIIQIYDIIVYNNIIHIYECYTIDQWFSTYGSWPLWGTNDSFTGFTYQIYYILVIYIMIYKISKNYSYKGATKTNSMTGVTTAWGHVSKGCCSVWKAENHCGRW